MTQTFDLSYDRSIFGTRDELAKLTGTNTVALAKILKEEGVQQVGTVRTGLVGKPPALFRVDDVRAAVERAQVRRDDAKAAAAAARKLKAGTVPANTDEPVQSDDSGSDVASQAV